MTKKERKQRMRQLLDSIKVGVWFTPSQVDQVNELTGFEYQRYRLMLNEYGNSTQRNLWVGDIREYRSWNKQIDDPKRERRDYMNPRIAMRAAVVDEMQSHLGQECVGCGGRQDLTVDHHTRPFSAIAGEFLQACGGTLDTDNPPGQKSGQWIADPELLEAWREYHRICADYQTLCRSCNSSKGNRLEINK